jgi:hypothetical protein
MGKQARLNSVPAPAGLGAARSLRPARHGNKRSHGRVSVA